ncbi:hypothetical protein KJ854_04625 [Patescibacteria group bacterium]|nr:hypothetical protein [Patescibacteria group bacterium]
MRFIPGEENWGGGPSSEEKGFKAPIEGETPKNHEVSKNETRESFVEEKKTLREISIIDNSTEGEQCEMETLQQIKEMEEITGLKTTSWKTGPDGTLRIMLEKLRKINHKNGWDYNPDLYKNGQAS